LLPGQLEGIQRSQDDDGGDASWLEFAREFGECLFLRGGNAGSLLDTVFGDAVSVQDITVLPVVSEQQRFPAISINLRNIVLADGLPVYWSPSTEALDAVTALIGVMGGRVWVRHAYTWPACEGN
jgi:hypothetical protein